MVSKNDKRIKEYLGLIFVSCIISSTNVVLSGNKTLVLCLFAFEFLVLLVFALKKRMTHALIFYIVCVCSALEFENWTLGDIYSIKTVKMAGLNLCIWLTIPVWILFISRKIKIGKIRGHYKSFYQFSKWLLLMNVLALLIGAVLLLVNDNGIRSINGFLGLFIGEIYNYMFLPLTFFCAFLSILSYEEEKLYKFRFCFQAVLWGTVFQIILSKVAGFYGVYGKETTLLISTLYFLLPLGILFSAIDDNPVFPRLNILVCSTGTILVILNNATGKIYLTLLIIVFTIFMKYRKSRNTGIKVFSYFAFGVVILVIVFIVSYFYNYTGMAAAKLRAAIELISIWNPNWLINLQYSPKCRIGEFLNIFIEFSHNPIFFLTGKGYMGTIKDYVSFFGDLTIHTDSFTVEEAANGIFYSLHEITSTLLVFGIIGISYNICLIKKVLKYLPRNPVLFIGAYWFCLLYGYSFTISTFGVGCFFMGLIMCDLYSKDKQLE